ncbi:hypothetical protein EDD86DRAFT_185545, partial [Gorgonomyces haynaldii]
MRNVEIQNAARLRTREVGDVMQRLLRILSENINLSIIVTELQWADRYSLEVLHQVGVACTRTNFMLFCRPLSTFESKETKQLIELFLQAPRFKCLVLAGFSLDETRQLILTCWENNKDRAKNVSPKLCQSIYNRTDGNPFFIKSLAQTLKDSGKWRVTPSGELIPESGDFDFEQLVLQYENQNIILARFDRIDRNLQLFLKVSAVLGLRFALDDVLFFMTGIQKIHSQVDSKTYSQLIRGVLTADRYSFLGLESSGPNGAFMCFKSAVVRKCIYNLMAHKQRQQLHLHAAQYFESRLTEDNKHRTLIPIFEHYMETDDSHLDKKVHYLKMVASFYYETGCVSEAAKYLKMLLDMAQELQSMQRMPTDKLAFSNWYRELGDSLFARGDAKEAFEALVKSLSLMGQILPETKYKMKWALKKQLQSRKKQDTIFFAN